MIETRLLQYFLAVARELNITKAAEALYISQPTLSKQMMELEQQLGKQLFIRGKRKLTLTEEGNFLRSRAQEILKLMDTTEAAFHTDETTLGGHVAIGCGETIAMDQIAALLADFHSQYPDVQLHTHSGDADIVLERLDKGLVDMGLLLGPIRQEKYDYLNLHQKDIYGLADASGLYAGTPGGHQYRPVEVPAHDYCRTDLLRPSGTGMVRFGLFGHERGCHI